MKRPDEDLHRMRIRARGRALRRLMDEYPDRYAELLREEELILDIEPHDGPRHIRHGRFPKR